MPRRAHALPAWTRTRQYCLHCSAPQVPEEQEIRRDEGDRQIYYRLPPPAGVLGVRRDLMVDTDEFGICMYDTQHRVAVGRRGETPVVRMDTMPGRKLSVIFSATSGACSGEVHCTMRPVPIGVS